MMKGLPLSYNRDMQEDKKPLFESIDTSLATLEVLTGIFKTASIKSPRCELASRDSFLYATDLLDYLVRKGIAFSDAHSLVGEIVLYSQNQEKDLTLMSIEEFQNFNPAIKEDVFKILENTQKSLTKNN